MKKLLFVFMLAFIVLIVGCNSPEKECSVDNDCVPASCCHASEAVNKDNAPDCNNVLCTMDCVEGTIDCGQGEIQCVKNQCEVVLN